MQTKPRNGATIEKLVIHTNEGPEGDHSAQGLASYLQSIDGGYHAIVDNVETVLVAGDDVIVEGAGGMNTHALHICFVGYANQTAAQWADGYSTGELHQAAAWLAAKCRQYGIPPVHLTPAQVATPGARGVCTHGDVTAAGFTASMGHTDPGPGFPMGVQLSLVSALLAPPEPKVKPMYHPPLVIVADLQNPQGGRWEARPDGRVRFVDRDGAVVEGGMVSPADVAAFRGRTVSQLKLRWYRTGKLHLRKAGYTIVASSGETYVPSGQR